MTHKKRLVFIAEYLGSSVNSTSYYWTKILESLASEFEVIVISPDSQCNVKYLESNSFEYSLYASIPFSKSNMLSRLWAYIRMSISFHRVSKDKIIESDILISGTNSIFNMFFLSRTKKRLGCSWLLFGYDIFPENLIPANVIANNNPLFKIASNIFSVIYSKPNDIVAVGRDMCELLSLKVKGNSRVHYIPNWADHNGVDLISKNDSKVLKKLNLTQSKSIIFQFFGNIGRLQDVYGLLEAIKLTKAKNSKFIFIGNGSEADAIDSIIQNGMDDRIHFYGKCEMSEKDHALSACDVAFVSLKEGMRGLAVPSKSYFSLAANKPIIVVGDDGSELRQLVDDYPIGWGCSSGKPILLAKLIDDICQNPNQLLSMSPRESLVNHFSEAKSLNEIKKLILTYM